MTVGTTTHLALNGHEYLIKPYSYSKRQAPQFGARFSTGDPDYNNLSMWQHWAQNCFVGGADQEEFQDDAMYDEGVGIDTLEHKRITLSRDIRPGTGANWGLSAGPGVAGRGYKAIVYNGALYVLTLPDATFEGFLYQYLPATDAWTRITSLDAANISANTIATNDGKLFIGGVAVSTTTPKLVYASGALGSWTTMANPSGVPTNRGIYAMRSFQQRLYVAFGTSVWRLKDNQTWDGNTVFYKADMDSESSYIVSMETHLGFLYMLSENGHVHRTDGNATFDIWSWEGQTKGTAIKSFDGRLFVLTFEYTNTANVGYGTLYQMSGSAVTMLKRWGDGVASTRIGNMTVYDRKLFYGASNLLGFGTGRRGFGVAVYDPVEDAHSIMASNSDTVTYATGAAPYNNYIVDDQFFFHGTMFVFVRGHGGFKTPYVPNDFRANGRLYDTTAQGGVVGSKNGGWLTTSTYDAGTPGVRKLWKQMVLDYRLPGAQASIFPEYSLDGGRTWTALAGLTTSNGVTDTRARFVYYFNGLASPSFKLRFTLRSTSISVTPILYGFVVSYIPIPEPNWMWTFTIVLSASQAAMDGSTLTVDTEAEMLFLENLLRTKALVTFIDIDGKTWASNGAGVLIYDMDMRVGQLTQPLEGEVVVTLLEAVETY